MDRQRMAADHAQGHGPGGICGERRRLLRSPGRGDVRAPGADDGDEPPVPAVRHDPRTGGLDEGGRPQAAALARCRQQLLPAPGKDGLQPWPL